LPRRDEEGEAVDDAGPQGREVHPATVAAIEAEAWCRIPSTHGTALVTNSAQWSPDGATFVAVEAAGRRVGWWPSLAWADAATVCDTLAAIFTAAASGTVHCADHGLEWRMDLPSGSLRGCPSGTHVRVCDEQGSTLDGGSAYWVCDEFVDDPELVMGAVLGAAARQC
jgi:hypothetical protein